MDSSCLSKFEVATQRYSESYKRFVKRGQMEKGLEMEGRLLALVFVHMASHQQFAAPHLPIYAWFWGYYALIVLLWEA